MKIEKYCKAKDLKEGDKLLTSDEARSEITVKGLFESGKKGNVIIELEDGQCADVPKNAFVLLPNTTEVYILQPSMP